MRQNENLESLQLVLRRSDPLSSWSSQSSIGLSYVCSRDYWRWLWVVQEIPLSKAVEIHFGQFTFSWDTLATLMEPSAPAGSLAVN
jgi:hypothetical protein